MDENSQNNNELIEEVPLDLFDQVALDEDDSIEIVDLSDTNESSESKPISSKAISIPADAYMAVLQAQRKNSK